MYNDPYSPQQIPYGSSAYVPQSEQPQNPYAQPLQNNVPRQQPNSHKKFWVILTIAGIICICAGISGIVEATQLTQRGVRTIATYVHTVNDGRVRTSGQLHVCSVSFKTTKGQMVETQYLGTCDMGKQGEQVAIFYDPKNPKTAIIDNDQTSDQKDLLMIGIGAIIMLIVVSHFLRLLMRLLIRTIFGG